MRQYKGQTLAVFVFECFMAVFYVVIAALLLLTNIIPLNDWLKIAIGVLFLAYGIFRIYRALKKITSK